MRTFFGVIGVLVALFSALLVAMCISDLVTGGDGKTEPGVTIGLLVFFAGTTLLGLWFAYRMLRKPKRSAFEIEQAILTLAAARGGRLTLAEVSTGCRLSVAEARAALQRLCGQGVADLRMTDTGVEVYAFAGFMDPEAKARARDVMDA
jgi:hypothetical protein